jgi:hypothetical protein
MPGHSYKGARVSTPIGPPLPIPTAVALGGGMIGWTVAGITATYALIQWDPGTGFQDYDTEGWAAGTAGVFEPDPGPFRIFGLDATFTPVTQASNVISN